MMKHISRWVGLAVLALAATAPVASQNQVPRRPLSTAPENPTLPNGKTQQDEILKADHERDLRDATQLIELAEELKKELEKNDRHVLSIASIKKTEEIEKLAKRIRGRIVR